jgi:hypothetical protein
MSIIPILTSNPLIILNYILAGGTLILLIFYFLKIISLENGINYADFRNGINYILLLSFIMIFVVLIYGFFYWFTASSTVGSNIGENTINLAKYLLRFSLNLFLQTTIISLFLIAWFLLKAFNEKKIEKAEKIN